MASAGGAATIKLLDHNSEASSVSVITDNLTAANFAAKLAQFQTLRSTVQAISMGTFSSGQLVAFTQRGSATPPSNVQAQREKKWLVTYEDNQQYLDAPTNTVVNNGFGKVFNIEVPCADLTLLQPNSDLADLTQAPMVAFIAALEAFALSPYGGTISVLQIRYVGRAL